MKLSDLKKVSRKIVIEMDGETAEIEYRVHAISAKFMEELREMTNLDSVISQVEESILRWELVDDEGKEIPVTREAIMDFKIPLSFMTQVLNAITEDIKRDKSEKNA